MELRIFKLLCLAATLLISLVVVPVNFLVRLPLGISLVNLVFGVATFFCYFASCRGRYYLGSLFFLFLLNLDLVWCANGGSHGSISFFLFIAFIYPLIFFRGRKRWLLLASAIMNGAGLLAAEPFLSDWIVPYHSASDRLVDLVSSLVVSALACSLMVWGVLTSFDRERRRLIDLNAELERAAYENQKLSEELDLRVQDRTAKLETAMQEQEAFSYSVSHDLRGPLRHINSYSAILEEECGACLTHEAHNYLARIRASSARMGALIADLLELSRIGRTELSRNLVPLSELASAASYRLQESEPERSEEFVIAPGLTVQGDRVLLGQLLENLLGNAWKYTGNREQARIELGTVQIGDQEAFFVRDNGVGFDMAYRDKLFRPFQRLHGSEFEGTGIGLATVKRIVERHGGTVWVEAGVDQGATVYFTLG